ncbi:MAG: hypothetical protein GY913_20945 [Proteobacteria bacterium]|nr:hypothetical protein [Pseudomonadota bacterium]MCP4919375.1 hypothetical protein [Pseudomonadota bacterium]
MSSFLLLGPLAWGHAGALIEGVNPIVDGDDAGLESSIGTFWGDRWICHETVTTVDSIILPRVVRRGGTWLASTRLVQDGREEGETVYRSTDGCDWVTVEGLTEVPVESLAFGTDQVFAASSDGRVFRSDDDGATWTLKTTFEAELESVRALDGLVAISGERDGDTLLAVSEDGFDTWTEHSRPDDEFLHAIGESGIWLAGNGLVVLFADGEAMTYWEGIGTVTDMDESSAGVVQMVQAQQVYVDGELTDLPIGLGVEGPYLAARVALGHPALSWIEDGEAVPLLWLADAVGPLECPEDSHVGATCPALWVDLEPRLEEFSEPPPDTSPPDSTPWDSQPLDSGPTETGEPDPDPDPDCGCSGEGSAALLLLPLLLLSRRRTS